MDGFTSRCSDQVTRSSAAKRFLSMPRPFADIDQTESEIKIEKTTTTHNPFILGHLLNLGKLKQVVKPTRDVMSKPIPDLFLRLGVSAAPTQLEQTTATFRPHDESSRDSGIDMCSPISTALDFEDTNMVSMDTESMSMDITTFGDDTPMDITPMDIAPMDTTPLSKMVMTPRRSIKSRIRGSRGPRRRLFQPVTEVTASPIKQCNVLYEQSNLFTAERSSEDTIKSALDSGDDLVGDFTRSYRLPTIPGKHDDLKSITVDTMSDVLNSQDISYTLIDCRYPYEYAGGHIQGALNLWNHDMIRDFYSSHQGAAPGHVVIFYCEFSSERGPRSSRYLRSLDRDSHKDSYPALSFPELYLVHGGYEAFHSAHQVACEPYGYTLMVDPQYVDQLKSYRAKSKAIRDGKTSQANKRRRLRDL